MFRVWKDRVAQVSRGGAHMSRDLGAALGEGGSSWDGECGPGVGADCGEAEGSVLPWGGDHPSPRTAPQVPHSRLLTHSRAGDRLGHLTV